MAEEKLSPAEERRAWVAALAEAERTRGKKPRKLGDGAAPPELITTEEAASLVREATRKSSLELLIARRGVLSRGKDRSTEERYNASVADVRRVVDAAASLRERRRDAEAIIRTADSEFDLPGARDELRDAEKAAASSTDTVEKSRLMHEALRLKRAVRDRERGEAFGGDRAVTDLNAAGLESELLFLRNMLQRRPLEPPPSEQDDYRESWSYQDPESGADPLRWYD